MRRFFLAASLLLCADLAMAAAIPSPRPPPPQSQPPQPQCVDARDSADYVPGTVTLINTIIVGFLALPGVLFQHWQGFGMREALYLLGSGGLVAFSNFLYIDALRTGAIAVVAPFRYTAAVWASIAGFLVWGDIPDWLGVLGTLFIIGSGLYTFYREYELAKARKLTEALSSPASRV